MGTFINQGQDNLKIAKELVLNEIIEIKTAKYCKLPTFPNKEIDEWFHNTSFYRKNIIRERKTHIDGQSAFIFYNVKNKQNENKVIIKVAHNIAQVIESDDYEIEYINLLVRHQTIMGGINFAITEIYEIQTNEIYKTYSIDQASDYSEKQLEDINRYMKSEMGVELNKKIKIQGISKIPVVLFKNEYDSLDTIQKRLYYTLEAIENVFIAMKDATNAAGPFFLIGDKGSQGAQNQSNIAAMLNAVGIDNKKNRFATIPLSDIASKFQSLTEMVANLSTNPMFNEYIAQIKELSDLAKKAVLTPTSTNGGKGTAQQHTAEIGANNNNTDDAIEMYKAIREIEWTQFGKMWLAVQGLPIPKGFRATLEIETQNDKIMEQKDDQENDFSKGKEKDKFQKSKGE